MAASHLAVQEAKKVLRRELKKRIAAMTSETKERESRIISEKLKSLEEYKLSQRISIYLHMPSEVNTCFILQDIFKAKKECFIPRYVGPVMDMLKLHSMEDLKTLPLTSWNILQPADDDTDREEALDLGGLDLVLLPGLGFSKDGSRLGRGKGYYDSYVKKCIEKSNRKPYLIGLAFSTQMCDDIPVSSHDVRLDRVLTCDPD